MSCVSVGFWRYRRACCWRVVLLLLLSPVVVVSLRASLALVSLSDVTVSLGACCCTYLVAVVFAAAVVRCRTGLCTTRPSLWSVRCGGCLNCLVVEFRWSLCRLVLVCGDVFGGVVGYQVLHTAAELCHITLLVIVSWWLCLLLFGCWR